jgi:hypothetical protein
LLRLEATARAAKESAVTSCGGEYDREIAGAAGGGLQARARAVSAIRTDAAPRRLDDVLVATIGISRSIPLPGGASVNTVGRIR